MQVISVNNDYASGKRRLAAFIIDRIIISTVFSLFAWHWWTDAFNYDYSNWHFGLTFSFFHLLREGVMVLYYGFMESSKYQATIGKIALGIKVVDKNNQRLQLPQALLRNFGKILSAFILGIGYIMIIFDDRKQGLHDKIAETFVVKA